MDKATQFSQPPMKRGEADKEYGAREPSQRFIMPVTETGPRASMRFDSATPLGESHRDLEPETPVGRVSVGGASF